MRKIIFILCLCVLASCATQQKVTYLQNNIIDTDYKTVAGGEIRLKPDDMVSIVVSSKNPELASVFNLRSYNPTSVTGENLSTTNSGGSQNEVMCYTVDPQGEIDYPVFGKLHIAGMTKFEISDMIKNKILKSDMIKDPIVTVEFANLTFSTLGEVGSPGQYEITKDKTTILEALSMSGDLAISGVRDRVFVTRNDGGKLKTYQLDLTTTDIYSSPAFYVQQNDLIYVEPNKQRANQSTVNANTLSTPSFWMSLTSFVLTLTLLFAN